MSDREKQDAKLPPKPEKPTPEECCGSGCVPCIYDYYYDAIEKWHKEVEEALKQKR